MVSIKNKNHNRKSCTRKKRGGGWGMPKMSMPKTLADFGRTKDKYGEIPLITFFCTALSRLAYLPDQGFIKAYANIMGPIFPINFLQHISDSAKNKPLEMMVDTSFKYELNDYASKINPVLQKVENQLIKGKENIHFNNNTIDGNVKHISLAWSKYGEIYIIADKRCPDTIFVTFRGTYSAATARIYSKLRSAKPVKLSDDVGVLYGIYKATCQLIHTIIESILFLHKAQKFNKSRIITTGHSLGGGMTTFFASLFYEAMNQKEYSNYPFFKNPVCVSVASPLVTDKSASNKYCKLIDKKQIFYKKIATRGDPVIMIPKLGFYSHICSHEGSNGLSLDGKKPIKQSISMSCNNTFNSVVMSSLSGIGSKMFSKKDENENSRVVDKITVNYDANVDCLDQKGRKYVMNPISHTIYLNISFITGVDLTQFATGMISSTTKEISYDKSITSSGESVCRMIYGNMNVNNSEVDSIDCYMKAGFFKFNELLNDKMKKVQSSEREKEENDKKNPEADIPENAPELENAPSNNYTKISPQDIHMNTINFDNLMNNFTKPLTSNEFIEKGHGPKDFSTQEFKELYNNFNNKLDTQNSMPILTGALKLYNLTGGRRRSKKRMRKSNKNRSNKSKR